MDVTDKASIENAVGFVSKTDGKLDILVNKYVPVADRTILGFPVLTHNLP